MELNGLLPIYKPSGMVSKDISRLLKRNFGSFKMGHAGTLDPMAQGVLPILWGQATKLQDYLLEAPKVYECQVQLGYATDTLDKEGKICEHKPFDHVNIAMVKKECESLQGVQEQVPPVYSAVKFQGKPLYDYARQGKAHQIAKDTGKKTIHVYRTKLISFCNGMIHFTVQTSKGAYVRSLAELLCHRLGTVGTLVYLKRSHSSGVQEEQCLSVKELEALGGDTGLLKERLISIEDLTLGLPKAMLTDPSRVKDIKNGKLLTFSKENMEDHLSTEETDLFLPSMLPRTVFLLDNNGRALAIVSVCKSTSHHMTIKVKRGFQ